MFNEINLKNSKNKMSDISFFPLNPSIDIALQDLLAWSTCSLCKGFLKRTVFIKPCLHSFCEPCIVSSFAISLSKKNLKQRGASVANLECDRCGESTECNEFNFRNQYEFDPLKQKIVDLLIRYIIRSKPEFSRILNLHVPIENNPVASAVLFEINKNSNEGGAEIETEILNPSKIKDRKKSRHTYTEENSAENLFNKSDETSWATFDPYRSKTNTTEDQRERPDTQNFANSEKGLDLLLTPNSIPNKRNDGDSPTSSNTADSLISSVPGKENSELSTEPFTTLYNREKFIIAYYQHLNHTKRIFKSAPEKTNEEIIKERLFKGCSKARAQKKSTQKDEEQRENAQNSKYKDSGEFFLRPEETPDNFSIESFFRNDKEVEDNLEECTNDEVIKIRRNELNTNKLSSKIGLVVLYAKPEKGMIALGYQVSNPYCLFHKDATVGELASFVTGTIGYKNKHLFSFFCNGHLLGENLALEFVKRVFWNLNEMEMVVCYRENNRVLQEFKSKN